MNTRRFLKLRDVALIHHPEHHRAHLRGCWVGPGEVKRREYEVS